MKFRPCIDLHQGCVKQIVGSTLTDEAGATPTTNFASDKSAADFAELYRRDGLYGGHVIMLGGGNEAAALQALSAFPKGMQVGGGVNADNAKRYLEAGASHVIVTSYVFRDGKIDYERLDALVAAVGKDNIVLDLSCRQKKDSVIVEGGRDETYFVVTDRWQKYTDVAVSKENLETLSKYCDEFLVHGVDVEGMRVGVMEDLVEKLGRWSPIPVTYAGGARSIADLELVQRLGNGRVDLTVGSALDVFGGDLKYDTVVKWHYANLFGENGADEIPDAALRQRCVTARASLAADRAAELAEAAFRASFAS